VIRRRKQMSTVNRVFRLPAGVDDDCLAKIAETLQRWGVVDLQWFQSGEDGFIVVPLTADVLGYRGELFDELRKALPITPLPLHYVQLGPKVPYTIFTPQLPRPIELATLLLGLLRCLDEHGIGVFRLVGGSNRYLPIVELWPGEAAFLQRHIKNVLGLTYFELEVSSTSALDNAPWVVTAEQLGKFSRAVDALQRKEVYDAQTPHQQVGESQ
jgi:hypothetical protein